MKASLRLGNPLGIPVGIHWSALLVGAFATWSLAGLLAALRPDYPEATYWVAAVLTVALYFAGLLAHELAHAVVARRHGIGTRGVTLWALGGLAELERQPDSPTAELRIAAAGPAASLAVGAGFLALAAVTEAVTDAGVLVTALFWLAVVNGILGVFNLLPARPLDGGRILTAVLWRRTGDPVRATLSASKVSVVLAWGLAGVGAWQLASGSFGGLWLLLIAWFVLSSARAEAQVQQWRGHLTGYRVGEVMGPPPPPVPSWHGVRDTLQAASGSPQEPLVVVGHDGRMVGITTLQVLARVALSRPDAALAEVARPLPEAARARRDELVADLLGGRRPAVFPLLVLDDDRVVGAVRPHELERWVRYARDGRAAWPAPQAVPLGHGS